MANNVSDKEESLLSGLGSLVKLLFFLIIFIYCFLLFFIDVITLDKYVLSGLMLLIFTTRYLAISVAVAHDFYRFPNATELFWNSNLTKATAVKVKMWVGMFVIPVLYLLNNMYHSPALYGGVDSTTQVDMSKMARHIGMLLIIYYTFLNYIYVHAVKIPKFLEDKQIKITDLSASDIKKLKKEQQIKQNLRLDFSTVYTKIASVVFLSGIFLLFLSIFI